MSELGSAGQQAVRRHSRGSQSTSLAETQRLKLRNVVRTATMRCSAQSASRPRAVQGKSRAGATVLLDTAVRVAIIEDMRKKIEPFYEALGAEIRKIRENRKMTQTQLGLALDPPSTRASIANIENGKQRVLGHTLSQLSRLLDVEVAELIPPSEGRAKAPSTMDVERELRKKLNLTGPTLKKLTALAMENRGHHA